jgi:catechol 2,3-dioxygenase-like lactoylglutathione lyase family enzyme
MYFHRYIHVESAMAGKPSQVLKKFYPACMPLVIILLAIPIGWFAPPRRNCQTRPQITGIARVALYSADFKASERFYGEVLGLSPTTIACGESRLCFSVNRQQQIDIIPLTTPAQQNLLADITFSTHDAEKMHCYLEEHGIHAGKVSTEKDGRKHFDLLDPEGHAISFVEGAIRKDFTPTLRPISQRLFHVGFVVRDSAAENRFYRELLGFRPYWQGGFKDADKDWEEIQVPDGSDWIEYMLNIPSTADHKELGVQNHFSLGVANAKKAAELLGARGLRNIDGPEIGRDGKWAADIYDPDLTRVELMEFRPAKAPCCNPYTAPHPRP